MTLLFIFCVQFPQQETGGILSKRSHEMGITAVKSESLWRLSTTELVYQHLMTFFGVLPEIVARLSVRLNQILQMSGKFPIEPGGGGVGWGSNLEGGPQILQI